ncbi:MAG: hypothetical protein HYU88_10485, partial [Chloroflexi bacterium]|nr:hypothetical protein [Chloroflexota bacterium]
MRPPYNGIVVRQGTPQKGKLGGSPAARERLGLALLIGVALALRVVWLDRLPPNVTADEADNLWVIFRIAETGQP